jgi:hypothetical protein
VQLLCFESSGTGALTSGTSDQRDTSTDPPTVSTGVVFNGAYNVESNGRVNAGFNYGNSANRRLQVKLYLISPSKFYILLPSSIAIVDSFEKMAAYR